MLPVASRKYKLIALLSPFTKRGVAAGARLVKLVANRRFVVSMKRSRAIYSGVLSTASHLPSGQRSVAMRSFAHVEHPHLRQRPVLFSAAASHSGQARHVASRLASVSGGVVAKPDRAKLYVDMPNLPVPVLRISSMRSAICNGSITQKQKLAEEKGLVGQGGSFAQLKRKGMKTRLMYKFFLRIYNHRQMAEGIQ
jgi:hypothetical protein